MTAASARGTPAAVQARVDQARRGKTRRFVTPEGVDLSLQIASASLRFGALMIDLLLMLVILVVITIVIGFGASRTSGSLALIVWLLGFFLLRNFWFMTFELGPRAATPGKRAVGIRVVARDGGRLTVAAVAARNLVRELEIFLPVTFIVTAGAEDAGAFDWALTIAGLAWTLAMGLFLLFNKDRMRLGDLIGGTWVVMAKRRKMAHDLSVAFADRQQAIRFSDAELSVYGVFELQELERVLREGDHKTRIEVSDAIRAKIGRPFGEADDAFLAAYYSQLKARMERDLLFGKRRANKFEEPA